MPVNDIYNKEEADKMRTDENNPLVVRHCFRRPSSYLITIFKNK